MRGARRCKRGLLLTPFGGACAGNADCCPRSRQLDHRGAGGTARNGRLRKLYCGKGVDRGDAHNKIVNVV